MEREMTGRKGDGMRKNTIGRQEEGQKKVGE